MRINQNTTNNSNKDIGRNVFDDIDIGKVGQGKFFTEGIYGHKKGFGLKGQLSKIKRVGRFNETKNLSQKNIESIYDMLSERLKKHTTLGNAHLTRLDKIAIMKKAEELVRTKGAKFTRYDKADVKDIISAIMNKSKQQSFGTERFSKNSIDQNDDSQEQTANILNNTELNNSINNKLTFLDKNNNIPDNQVSETQKTKNTNITDENNEEAEIPDTHNIKDMPI